MRHGGGHRARLAAAAGLLVGCAACAGGPGAAPDPLPPGPSVPTSAPGSAAPLPSSPAPSAPAASPTPYASSPGTRPTATRDDPAPTTLPGGGRTVFPQHRLVGYAGLTGARTLGRLGTGPLDSHAAEMVRRARPYAADGKTVLPVMEVIATTVQAGPGRDGRYRARMADAQVERYLRAARRHGAVLLLAIQPGRSDFLTEVRAYDRWLAEPDVGVALDPEWAMGPGQVPGRAFGHTTGAELDAVSRHLARLVAEHDLPEKIMVFHELAPRIVTGEGRLRARRGVAVVKSVDGIGVPGAKKHTYRMVNHDTPAFVAPGFKLFYDEDAHPGPLMTPTQVMALHPRPSYVLYE